MKKALPLDLRHFSFLESVIGLFGSIIRRYYGTAGRDIVDIYFQDFVIAVHRYVFRDPVTV